MLFRLLFPGVIFHELAHYLACVIFGVKVFSTRLFDSREAFVQHAKPNAWQAIGISIAPFALNNILAAWLLFLANDFVAAANPAAIVFYWLAVSLAFHSFPSDTDAMNAFNATKESCLNHLKAGSIPKRIAWLALTPIIFLPTLFLTGLLLLFDKSAFLKIAWVFIVVWTALQPPQLILFINNTLA